MKFWTMASGSRCVIFLRGGRRLSARQPRPGKKPAAGQGKRRSDRREKREEKLQAEQLAESRRKNDLLQASLAERQRSEAPVYHQAAVLKPHRAGSILALGLLGLLFCGPLCLAAWVMGNSDLSEMEAGLMDKSGQSTTATGRTVGAAGTILWVIAVLLIIMSH